MASNPTHFLVPNPPNPATVDQSGDWHKIVGIEKLTESDDSAKTGDNDPPQDANVSFTSGTFWGLNFTSKANLAYFGASLSVDTLLNTAWIGDDLDSGLMLLAPQAQQPIIGGISLQGNNSICQAFGIDNTTVSSALQDFLKVIDASQALQAQVYFGNTENPSAVWCITTTEIYQTVVQLTFTLVADDSKYSNAITWLQNTIGINIDLAAIKKVFAQLPDILITLNKTTFYTFGELAPSSVYALSFQFTIIGFNCSVEFSQLGNHVILSPTSSSKAIYASLVSAVGAPSGIDSGQLPSGGDDLFAEFFEHINLWYIVLQEGTDAFTGASKLSWEISLLLSWTIGSGSSKTPILVGLSYDSSTSTFLGQLIFSSDHATDTDLRLPSYDQRLALPHDILLQQGIDTNNLPSGLDLWDLVPDHGTPPNRIPHILTAAQISYQTLPGSSVLSFYVEIKSTDATSSNQTSGEAPSGFVWDEISVSATIARAKGSDPQTDIQIFSAMSLNPPQGSQISPAQLDLTLTYDKSSSKSSLWTLQGSVDNLSVALLASYFDSDTSDGAMAVLGNITLKNLDLFYSYASGSASSFLISAVLALGKLELDLSYQYVSSLQPSGSDTAASIQWGTNPPDGVSLITPDPSKLSQWKFEAFLKIGSPGSDIASIAESISPGAAAKIPEFVGGIVVSPKSDPTNAPVKLVYQGNNVTGSILTVWLSLGLFNLTFIQYCTPKTDSKSATVKRLLRISVDQIPAINAPLVGQLPQPFDHLTYLWIEDDDTTQTDASLKGFTKDMVIGSSSTAVNTILVDLSIPPIQLKDSATKVTGSNIILQAGHHFVVSANGKVVLDHVFQDVGSAAPPPKFESVPLHSNAVVPTKTAAVKSHAVVLDDTKQPDATPTKGQTDLTVGPLTVSGLSLQYKDGALSIMLDATLVLGAITFGVQGFAIRLDLTQVKLDDLSTVVSGGHISVNIQGLDAGVSKPPLTIAGTFVHQTDTDPVTGLDEDIYKGGVAVGFEAWDILAVGEYKIVTNKDGSTFKSVFIYGKLDGPLVELEFATISGVRLGFGYNSAVYLPGADQLYSFPFINDAAAAGSGNDPMKVQNQMVGGTPPYVYTKEGSCWFCAGMTIKCFDCIILTTVMMFEIDTSGHKGPIIALLADGIFQMEPDAPPDLSLFYVELLIKIELNFDDGYIAADAALAPASHVYAPQAHLTGSGSFYSWFAPNSHAGDWVISIGGYHKSYSPPTWYPRPARLGLNFTIGDGIQIVGEGYAAVTPKCAMAGGSLHMSLGVGPVSAYCDLVLDVFVNFKPFYFIAEISLSIGVECDIDILFIHIHISISIGADLTVWGPDEFGGLAHVDFWFFGFDIRFGGALAGPPPVHLQDFYEMVRTPGPTPTTTPAPSAKTSVDDSTEYLNQHKYSVEAGVYPVVAKSDTNTSPFPNTGANVEFTVQSGTCLFRIDCDMALTSGIIVVDEKDRTKDVEVALGGTVDSICAFPMHITKDDKPLLSTIEIRIYSLDAETPVLQAGFSAEMVVKSAATAVWGPYTGDSDPLSNPLAPNLQKHDNPTVNLNMSVRIHPPSALLSRSPIVDFDATAAMMSEMQYNPVTYEPQQTTYLSAPYEAGIDPKQQWPDFGNLWNGTTDPTINGLKKSEVRGDGGAGAGMMGLCADALGWTRRPAAEKSRGLDVPGADGRYEWQLKSDPPAIYAAELGYYYLQLPMWSSAST